eukprot:362353-Chlamydomonas_euryale.AAC.4
MRPRVSGRRPGGPEPSFPRGPSGAGVGSGDGAGEHIDRGVGRRTGCEWTLNLISWADLPELALAGAMVLESTLTEVWGIGRAVNGDTVRVLQPVHI